MVEHPKMPISHTIPRKDGVIMAKKRNIMITLFKHAPEGSQIKARIEFTLKLFDGDVPQDHTMNLDLLLPKGKLEALAANTVVIDVQKRLRELGDHAKVRAWTASPVTYDRVYPGRGATVIKRELTDAEKDALVMEAMKKAKSDPTYRARLMAELGEIE
jgi:type IV pilus biogenesis protein CpaD/CtpE